MHLADGAAGWLFALRDEKLHARDPSDTNGLWQSVTLDDGTSSPDLPLSQIAPISVENQNLAGDLDHGLVAIDSPPVIDSPGVLYAIKFDRDSVTHKFKFTGTCTKLLDTIETRIAPAAVLRRSDDRLVAVAIGFDASSREFCGFLSHPNAFTKDDEDRADLVVPNGGGASVIIGSSIDLNINGGGPTFAVCLTSGGASAVAAWSPVFPPSGSGVTTAAYIAEIPSAVGFAEGAPTLLPQHVLVPTSASEVLVTKFDPRLLTGFETVVVTELPEDNLIAGDSVAFLIDNAGTLALNAIPGAGVAHQGKVYHIFHTRSFSARPLVYKASTVPIKSTVDTMDLTQLALEVGDTTTHRGSILLITSDKPPRLYKVDNVSHDVATLTEELDVSDLNQPIHYQNPDHSQAIVRPLMRLNPNGNGAWDAALLDRTRLQFPGADPEFQVGTAFEVDSGRPVLVALAREWITAPPDLGMGVRFLIVPSVGDWTRQLGDSSINPELSWEYWNGTGWWTLGAVHDDTLNLKRTGNIRFTVPSDLRETDWSGKTNHWIRARLIGGDYGQEKVTVKTTDVGGGKTEQTVERSVDGIRAPSVLKLSIFYGLCEGVRPMFVLAEDSGSIRDQSDANRTTGAIVEAFVPLAVMLGRLSKGAALRDAADGSLHECNCQSQHARAGATPTVASHASPDSSALAIGRELFIGLAAPPSEAPVNVLLLVEEQRHTEFAPMRIEALVADRFVPIVADDGTRALGESGLLSMAFTVPPTPSELFGRTLTWLRLTPKPSSGKWIPALRGAYLNAVWADATESLTRELLGSSDGSPNLTVRLARPPVLRDSLELRVREPLGDEDRKALLRSDKNTVLSDVEGLPGDWVLWTQVVDPDDEPAAARVYALEESIGEIRFGDGVHGRIPPIGRDSIVAFRYGRTEPDPTGGDSVPGNTIAARTALNLVSPVENVESVIAADQAAGGAPPESDNRVLRFGFARLRHRNRAVTAHDIEDLALQSSPDIVQARVFVRCGYIRLVVVMRGKNPQPNAAQIRELHRLLLDAAPVSLSAPNALRIEGPKIRRLRIELDLLVETLDHAGTLAAFVKQKVAAFFDTATGGPDTDGWALGVIPNEEDIAFALIDAPYLESISQVALREITADGKVLPSLEMLKASELVMLANDPIRIEFETAEVLV